MRRRLFRLSQSECDELQAAMTCLIQETLNQTQQHLDDGGNAINSEGHYNVLQSQRDLERRLAKWKNANYPARGGKRK